MFELNTCNLKLNHVLILMICPKFYYSLSLKSYTVGLLTFQKHTPLVHCIVKDTPDQLVFFLFFLK